MVKAARVLTGATYEPGDIVVVTAVPLYGNSRREFLARVVTMLTVDTFTYEELPPNWEHEVVELPGWEDAPHL